MYIRKKRFAFFNFTVIFLIIMREGEGEWLHGEQVVYCSCLSMVMTDDTYAELLVQTKPLYKAWSHRT